MAYDPPERGSTDSGRAVQGHAPAWFGNYIITSPCHSSPAIVCELVVGVGRHLRSRCLQVAGSCGAANRSTLRSNRYVCRENQRASAYRCGGDPFPTTIYDGNSIIVVNAIICCVTFEFLLQDACVFSLVSILAWVGTPSTTSAIASKVSGDLGGRSRSRPSFLLGLCMIFKKICNDGNTMIEVRSVLIYINLVECAPKCRLMTSNSLHYNEQLGKVDKNSSTIKLPNASCSIRKARSNMSRAVNSAARVRSFFAIISVGVSTIAVREPSVREVACGLVNRGATIKSTLRVRL